MSKLIKKWGSKKTYIYSKLPFSGNTKKMLKNLYYDKFAWTLFRLKNKKNYGIADMFGSVNIETTTYCNFRCKWCPNSKYERGILKNKKLMPVETFKKIINELAEMNFKGIIKPFFWGEPLTDERLPEFARYTKKKLPKTKIYVNSNGSLLTIPIYKKLINSGVDVFAISQYSKEMLPNVKEIYRYLKENPDVKNKIQYRIFTEDLANSNRGGEVEVKKIADRPLCQYPGHYDLSINYNGDVVLCCVDYLGQHKFGNVKEEKIINIWNKSEFKKVRADVLENNFKFPMCRKCVGTE